MPDNSRHFFYLIENPSLFRIMAYSTNSLINLVSGNARDCTFYLMNGEHVSRRKAKTIRNPRTISQQLNRDNIRPLIDFYRQLKPILYLSLNDRQNNQTAYNKFLSINLNKSIKKGSFAPEKFLLTSGSFQSTKFKVIRKIDNLDNFIITWRNDSNIQKLNSDKLLCVYYNFFSNTLQYSITSKSRSDLAASTSFVKSNPEPRALLYLFFVRADYSKSSKIETIGFS